MKELILFLIIGGICGGVCAEGMCAKGMGDTPAIPENLTGFNETLTPSTTTTIYSDTILEEKDTLLNAEIVSPEGLPNINWDEPIRFNAYAYGGKPPYSFKWISSLDGIIGRERIFTRELSAPEYFHEIREHKITLEVRDSTGKIEGDDIRVLIRRRSPPNASIKSPKERTYLGGEVIELEFSAWGGRKPYAIEWILDGKVVEDISNLSLEKHLLTLIVKDKNNMTAVNQVRFSVVLCNVNGICEANEGENYLNCSQDCKSGSGDNHCDKIADGRCDPDCSRSEDQDCLCNRNGVCETEFENHLNCKADCKSGSPEGYCDSLSDGVCDPDCDGSDPDCGVNYSNYVMVLIAGMFMFGALYYIKLKIGAVE